mmetsp:Transcript_24464/g.28837  ORF Transcript_24464/g.28837 Transcript_24464/m.28837 type:complete len:458 (-) Transcript_24464:246-1619(-)|eukprot:CAMPEP_0198254928 /NCGR_PEP_ID=MMETSP1447-20131203/5167_1 /TAXON_ID=420782 /ORGANISM="Chaetoceros dichaeta, Strain CCMP1751" /LENGTH=457 /DNA_ID=CAMNT_0043941179 /DNA_START=73 /DNA_END=1446 /DNA_ORIENTATION=-
MGENNTDAKVDKTETTPDATTDTKNDVKDVDAADKTSETPTTPSEISPKTVAEVASRLRFFFSNANLRIDKFLRREVTENNADGFVPIETLLRFNTIKIYSTEPQALVRAIEETESLKPILKLNEDKTGIARIEPFTHDMMRDNVGVTLRVSNIPVEGAAGSEVYTVKREEVEEAFKEFGYVAMVRMLYNYQQGERGGRGTRTAIGRAFVEMETTAEMQLAAAELCPPQKSETKVTKETEAETKKEETEVKEEQPKRTLTMGGAEVRVKTMQQWLDQREVKRIARFGDRGDSRNSRGGRGGRGQRDTRGGEKRDFKGQEKRAREAAEKEAAAQLEFKLEWKKGCVISVKGLPDGCDREKILGTVQDVVGKDVRVRADYSRGQKDGAIRFEQPNDKIVELAAKLCDGSAMVGGVKVESATIIQGEDEEKYYSEYIAFRTKQIRTNAEEKNQRKRPRRR